MKNTSKNNVVKATKEGRLYKKTADFFNQPKIRETISRLRKSKVVKDIEEKAKLAGAQ